MITHLTVKEGDFYDSHKMKAEDDDDSAADLAKDTNIGSDELPHPGGRRA